MLTWQFSPLKPEIQKVKDLLLVVASLGVWDYPCEVFMSQTLENCPFGSLWAKTLDYPSSFDHWLK